MLSSIKGSTLYCKFKDVHAKVDALVWKSICDLKCTGMILTEDTFKNYGCYNKFTFIKKKWIIQMPSQMQKISKTDYRLLHGVISKCLDVREHNYAKIIEADLFMMWLISEGTLVNWPAYFARKMMIVKKQISSALPFCFISLVLECFNMILSTHRCIVPYHANGMSKTTLSKMKLLELPISG